MNDLPHEFVFNPANHPRNPGVAMVWVTTSYLMHQNPKDLSVVFSIGDASEVPFFAEGRKATKAEIMHSIDTGLPILQGAAESEGDDAVKEILRRYHETKDTVEACA